MVSNKIILHLTISKLKNNKIFRQVKRMRAGDLKEEKQNRNMC